MSSLVKTPGRELARASASIAQKIPLPPSPAAVTDAIDQQTTRIRTSVTQLYARSGVHEFSDSVRDALSTPIAVDLIALAVEAYGLRKEILPSKAIGNIPAIPFIKSDKTTVFVPDLFLLLGNSFWAPFSLWMLTSLLIPLACAYFINVPLKHIAGPGSSSRRTAAVKASPSMQFDPLIFNVTKGLIAYLVYAEHFNMLGLYQHFTITTVNESVLGGYFGIITGAGVGGLISLYDAVLKK